MSIQNPETFMYKNSRPPGGAGGLEGLFGLLACVDLSQAAFAGFTETMVQIDAGFVHGTANHIIADVSRAREEIAQIAGVHCP